MTHGALLLGWDAATWRRVAEWAGSDANFTLALWQATADDYGHEVDKLFELQTKWFEAGGPMSGPTGTIILEAA